MRKYLTKNFWNFEVWAVQKHVNLVDLVKSFRTIIYLPKLASIQPRTSHPKFSNLVVVWQQTKGLVIPAGCEHSVRAGDDSLPKRESNLVSGLSNHPTAGLQDQSASSFWSEKKIAPSAIAPPCRPDRTSSIAPAQPSRAAAPRERCVSYLPQPSKSRKLSHRTELQTFRICQNS